MKWGYKMNGHNMPDGVTQDVIDKHQGAYDLELGYKYCDSCGDRIDTEYESYEDVEVGGEDKIMCFKCDKEIDRVCKMLDEIAQSNLTPFEYQYLTEWSRKAGNSIFDI